MAKTGNYIQSYPELNGNSRKEPENQGLSQEVGCES
jgi:hypothetical protein